MALTMLCWVLSAAPARAQSRDGYELTGSTIAAGGHLGSEGGEYEMDAAVGQAEAGTLSGSGYELSGGFWAAFCVPVPYGDIAAPWDVVDVDDILRVLDGFSDPEEVPEADIDPCTPDGDVDVDDILAVLNAFSGVPWCPPPCR